MTNTAQSGPGFSQTAVITVSYGSDEALQTFLGSLRKYHGNEVPVVIVDNKPDAGGVAELAHHFSATYVPLPNNPGYGAGMNAGVQALSGMNVNAYFFCNPDLRFIEPSIGRLAEQLSSKPRTGSVGPRLLNDDGTVYPSARNIPSLSTGIGHGLFGHVWPGNPWTRAYQLATDYSQAREAGWLSGAAVMVSRRAYEQVGGWDEAYFMHFEDIDLGYRLGLAGFKNMYEPMVAIEHSGAHSTRKHAVMVERAMTRSAIRFMSKRYPGPVNAPIRWALTLALRVRGVLKIVGAKRAARMGGTL